jgi:hypothetical protein
MRWPFLLALVSWTTFGVNACTSLTPAGIEIYADDFPLSAADIRDIQRLALLADIKKPVTGIRAQRADEVSVICGADLRTTDLVYFTARRRHGHWFIDKSSIKTRRIHQDERIFVTGLTMRWSERLAALVSHFR